MKRFVKPPDELTGRAAAHGSVLLTGASFVGIAIRMATMVILTRELGASDFGLYVLAFSVHLAISSGYFLAAHGAVIADTSRYIGAQSYGSARRLLTEYSALQLLLGVILAGGTAVFIPFFRGGLLHEKASDWLVLLAVLVALTALKKITSASLSSHGNFGVMAAQQLVEALARLIAIVVLVLGLGRGIGGALEADVIGYASGLVVATVMAALAMSYMRACPSRSGWILPSLYKKHGKWDVLTAIGTQLTQSAANWVMAGILSTEAVGIYAVAKRSIGFAKSAMPLKTVMSPLMARHVSDPARLRRIFNKSLQYRVQLNLLLAIVGGALAYPVFRLLFPDFFPLVLVLFLLLLLRYVLNSYNVVTNPLIQAMQAQRMSFGLLVVRRALYIALSPVLMVAFGVVGAAVESLVTTLVISVVKYRLVARLGLRLKIDVSSFFRFEPEDRALVREVMVGKLKRFRTRRSEPRPQ